MRLKSFLMLSAAMAGVLSAPAVAAPELDDRLDLMLSCGALYILYAGDKSVAQTKEDEENLRAAGIMLMNEVEAGLADQNLSPEELQQLGAERTEEVNAALQENGEPGFDSDDCTPLLNEVAAAGGEGAEETEAAATGGGLLTGADTDAILNIARGHGSASLTTQDNGDPLIEGKVEGVPYYVFFRNCTDGENCEDLNFYTGFANIKPGLEKINEWNATKRFSRAYLDADEDAVIEMDLDLAVGVTSDYMDSTFQLWTLVLDQYKDFIGYQQ